MTKTKSKSALLASGLSLVLCFAMLLGTTFAWFSDSVSNKGNKITAGNLKIGFYVSDTNATLPAIGGSNDNWKNLKLNADPIFTMGTDNDPAQPGDTLTKYIAIRNEGNIALQYYLDFLVNDGGLGDAVTFTLQAVSPRTLSPKTVTGSQLANEQINGSSAPSKFIIYKMDLTFLESAGNTYQGGSFEVDLNLTATQSKDGAMDSLIKAKDASDFKNVKANSTIVLQKNITTAEAISIENFANIDLNGYTLTCKEFSIVKDNAIGTIDIANGKIVADNIKASAAKGSVNITGVNGTVSENGKVYLNGSMNTVNLLEGTKFQITGTESPAPIEIPSETRVVVKTEEKVAIAIPANGQQIIIEDNRANVTEKTIAVQVAEGTTGVEIKNKPDATPENKIEVTGDGKYDIVEDNVNLKTRIRLSGIKSGSNHLDEATKTINNFGYIGFKSNREIDFTKAVLTVQQSYRVNENGIVDESEEFTLSSFKRSTRVYAGMLNATVNGKTVKYPNNTLGSKPEYQNVTPKDTLIATNETNVLDRFPEIYNAILNTKNTKTTVDVVTVITITDEYGDTQTWKAPVVNFSNGTVTTPGI